MSAFYDRERDLADLNKMLDRSGAQLLLLSGRRRVGKTTLIIEWARRSGKPYFYWVATQSSAAALFQSLSQALWHFLHPSEIVPSTFAFDSWTDLFRQIGKLANETRLICILDEWSHVAEGDPSSNSHLQNAWDHHLKQTNVCVVLSGSHVSLMNQMQEYRAPLYGRFTAHLRVDPLPFHAVKHFLPHYDTERRVAVYAILGTIPHYLQFFKDQFSLRENIERNFIDRIGSLRNEAEFLLSELMREPRNYAAIIQAIAGDRHTPDEIERTGLIPPGNTDKYLARLLELQLIERRVPATIPLQRRTTLSRYYLRDPFLRFYHRFIEPNRDMIELEFKDALWQIISDNLRAFVGVTAFEELCREWCSIQARTHRLPFAPQTVGSHWSADVQVDVVALSWREKAILLGECKWTAEPISRAILTELIEEKTPRVLASLPEGGSGWQVHYAAFSRAGFTPPTIELAKQYHAQLITLEQLDHDLSVV